MSLLDDAYQAFLEIKASVPPEDDKPINEACTRFRLIDPILTTVLGWPRSSVEVELPAGEGANEGRARLDYLLRDGAGLPWFVVEAKKRDRDLLLREARSAERRFKLTGPALRECWPIIDKQMASYLGRYMPRYGIVTNGEQWVGFLNAARPEAQDLADSYGYVFRSLDDIDRDFDLFLDAFGSDGAARRRLHHLLDPEGSRGVIHCPSPERVVLPHEERMLSYQYDEPFYEQLKRAMEAAFSPIQDDPDAMAKCFVESKQSREADSRLERLASELQDVLKDASEHYPTRVAAEVSDAREMPGEGMPAADELEGQGCLVRLLGEESAGKTVFLRRFYTATLGSARQHIALIWIDAEKHEPFDGTHVSQDALAQLRQELFGEAGPEWKHLREVYAKEWQGRLRALGIEGDDKPEVRREFVVARENDEQAAPALAFKRYAAFAVRNRRKIPCIVVDNVDDSEKPSKAVSWAIAMHLSTFSLTTVALEDTTLWRLRAAADDQLSKLSPEQFWLYRPKVREVLENRCTYLRSVLGESGSNSKRAHTRLGRYRQFQWTVSPETLTRTVSSVFMEDQRIANWIGQVCNYHIRSVLDLCKQIVLSPHLKASSLLAAQATQRPPHPRSILKAIIAPRSEQFQGQPTDVVMNVFGQWAKEDWAPLLPARLLSLLAAREDSDKNRKESFPGFLPVETLVATFDAHAGVPSGITRTALDKLLAVQLVEAFDPSHRDLTRDAKVRITPRGRIHLAWCLEEPTYVRMMAEVDPLVDVEATQDLRAAFSTFLGGGDRAAAEAQMATRYVRYLLDQARRVSPSLDHEDVLPIREFELKLRAKWVGTTH